MAAVIKRSFHLMSYVMAGLICLWPEISLAMEEVEVPSKFEEIKNIPRPYKTIPDRDEATLPKGYVHNAVGHQINDYRKLYKAALAEYGDDYELMRKSPIKGLPKIAKNAFALAHDVILEARNGQTEELKNLYLTQLENLWETFPKEQDAMLSSEFQKLNFSLAAIIDDFNSNKEKPTIRSPWDTTWTESDYYTNKEIVDNDYPIFIIYAKPETGANRGIASHRFVDEYFNNDFKAYLALFDVLSIKPEQPTTKNVHYSIVEGTYKMLLHDFQHVHWDMLDLYDKGTGVYTNDIIYILTKKIYDKAQELKESGNLNGYNVLMNGLFLLIHEERKGRWLNYQWKTYAGRASQVDKNYLENNYPNFVRDLRVPDAFINKDITLDSYRMQYSDWEYFLKLKDEDGHPYFDHKTIEKNERYEIPDPNLLPNYYERNSPSFGKIKLSKLYREKLNDAYTRFWSKFKELALQ